MNINNNYGKYNNEVRLTQNGLQSVPNARLNALKKDTFRNKAYITAPVHKYGADTNQNINNIYTPSQLLKAYLNPSYVKFLINTNENIKNMMEENGLDCKVYPENISKVTKQHLVSTTAIALQIANQMDISDADKRLLEQACTFHDFGKILIPPEILKKPCELTSEERQIMDLHSELGYELLSSTGMNNRVLELVKNHHKPDNETNDILEKILSVADVYSALREERSYKPAMTEKQALAFLDEKAETGMLNKDVVNSLKNVLVSNHAA